MKLYLKSIAEQLKRYSLSLDKTSILIDKPWALIDDEFEMQKLIFKKNKELILSKNGQVQEGKWDYFPEARSILIDRGTDKILCNEAFIDEGIMILKLDGTKNRFFVLANENVVPDLDAQSYLKKLRYQKLKILATELVDGRILEVQKKEEWDSVLIGKLVSIESEPVKDGKYKLAQSPQYYEIKKSKISNIFIERKYISLDGIEIIIHHKFWKVIEKGDQVFLRDTPLENIDINFSRSKNLIVRDGKVVRLERKKSFGKWISKLWKKN